MGETVCETTGLFDCAVDPVLPAVVLAVAPAEDAPGFVLVREAAALAAGFAGLAATAGTATPARWLSACTACW
jgi:hypothetical protein